MVVEASIGDQPNVRNIDCVYRKPKSERSGDEARRGSGVNE
jgi:hypothetical protein